MQKMLCLALSPAHTTYAPCEYVSGEHPLPPGFCIQCELPNDRGSVSISRAKLIQYPLSELGCTIEILRLQIKFALVAAIYRNPKFRIKIPEGISDEHPQTIGIRQGCPLSSYLYIVATSCLTKDFLQDYQTKIQVIPEGLKYPTLLFADDTLPLMSTARQMTDTLGLTIAHSDNYNLSLNKEKCQLLVTNDLGCNVLFPDRTPVTKHDLSNTWVLLFTPN